jgi:hypothetical protein
MIERVTVEDLPKVADLAKWFYYRMNPEGNFSTEAWLKAWTHLLSSGSGLILRRGNLEAIGIILYPDPNDGLLAAGFGFWYVAADDDSLANGLLHQRLMDDLRAMGVNRSLFSNLIGPRYDRVGRFLLHAGYRPVEVVHRKDLN